MSYSKYLDKIILFPAVLSLTFKTLPELNNRAKVDAKIRYRRIVVSDNK